MRGSITPNLLSILSKYLVIVYFNHACDAPPSTLALSARVTFIVHELAFGFSRLSIEFQMMVPMVLPFCAILLAVADARTLLCVSVYPCVFVERYANILEYRIG